MIYRSAARSAQCRTRAGTAITIDHAVTMTVMDPSLAPTYPLLTERLSLRPPTPADAEAIHVYKGRADVTRWVPHGVLSVEAIAERAGLARQVLTEPGQHLHLLAFTRDTGDLVGDGLLFWHSAEHRGGEIGYIIDPRFGGRGYATEIAREMLRLGFDELGLHRIVGRIYAPNTASERVLQRLGMRREAYLVSNELLRGEWTDEIDYALTEDEWHATESS